MPPDPQIEPFLRGYLHFDDRECDPSDRLSRLRAAITAFGEQVRAQPEDQQAREYLCFSLFEKARIQRPDGVDSLERGEAEVEEMGRRWPDSDAFLRVRAVALYSRARCHGKSDAAHLDLLVRGLADADVLLGRDPDHCAVLGLRVEILTAIIAISSDRKERQRLALRLVTDADRVVSIGSISENLLWSRVSARYEFWSDESQPTERVIAEILAAIEDLEALLVRDPASDCLHGQIASMLMHLCMARSALGQNIVPDFKHALEHVADSHPADPEALAALEDLQAGLFGFFSKCETPVVGASADALFGLVEVSRSRMLRRRGGDFLPPLIQARRLLRAAVRKVPNAPVPRADLAIVHTDLGEDEAAMAEFEAYRKLRPEDANRLKAELKKRRRLRGK